MKRFFCIACVLLSFLAMTACDPGAYRFGEELNAENVVTVELIQFDNSKQKNFVSWVPDHSGQLLDMDLSDVTVLETLEEDMQQAFVNQLSMEEILWKYYAYNSPKGICIRVTYSNGDYLIISGDYENRSFAGYIGMYSADGVVKEFYGTFTSFASFESLVNDYFETKV